MAGLATHYAVSADGRIYTFYLRGHPQPTGTRLPNTDTLRQEYAAGELPEDLAHGSAAPPDNVPARWSDGRVITAGDFVYSWRREVDPATASLMATYLYGIRNAREINRGKKPPESLGVEAVDNFTLRVELDTPVGYFLKIVSTAPFSAVPKQAIDAARAKGEESAWTKAGSHISSGAFRLREWRPNDKIVLQKNPAYYEADLVRLEEITFLLVSDRNTNMNIYRAGEGHFMDPSAFDPAYLPLLRKKNDYREAPWWGIERFMLRVTKAPLDNVLVRYALNMAVDKNAIAEVTGETPAYNFVPPIPGYEPPRTLPVPIDGKIYDVLSFNPAAARELLAKAGFRDGLDKDGRRLTISLIGVDATATTELYAAQVLQQQWRKTLGVEANILQGVGVDEALRDFKFQGAMAGSWAADYADANDFLEPLFVTGEANNDSGWSDPRFDAMLTQANRQGDPTERKKMLAHCETQMLKGMPVIPIAFQVCRYLRKPFVHGLWPDPFSGYAFQYAWIDTNWRRR
jgi:ABC-type oligopeptide transport system substrate-binding subunit